jgi:hypothetical protein
MERFELEMLGDVFERRYRKMRPEVEAMPWGTLDLATMSAESVISARRAWTGAAYQEHRTGIAVCAALRACMEARAPLDLIALATRFPLDEMVHVELCARMAMECGGGTEIVYDPSAMSAETDPALSPLLRAVEICVRYFCVGEALSIPLLRGTWKAARHPLPRAVLGRIVRDEAAHGTFGFAVLDWASPRLTRDDLALLGRSADGAITAVRTQWDALRQAPSPPPSTGDALAWMRTDEYLALAARSLERQVVRPLVERGVPIEGVPPATTALTAE